MKKEESGELYIDCGDNSCIFKPHNSGGMRTNGGCSCLDELPEAKRRIVKKMFLKLQWLEAERDDYRDALKSAASQSVRDLVKFRNDLELAVKETARRAVEICDVEKKQLLLLEDAWEEKSWGSCVAEKIKNAIIDDLIGGDK